MTSNRGPVAVYVVAATMRLRRGVRGAQKTPRPRFLKTRGSQRRAERWPSRRDSRWPGNWRSDLIIQTVASSWSSVKPARVPHHQSVADECQKANHTCVSRGHFREGRTVRGVLRRRDKDVPRPIEESGPPEAQCGITRWNRGQWRLTTFLCARLAARRSEMRSYMPARDTITLLPLTALGSADFRLSGSSFVVPCRWPVEWLGSSFRTGARDQRASRHATRGGRSSVACGMHAPTTVGPQDTAPAVSGRRESSCVRPSH
jgi:hypothetical protein